MTLTEINRKLRAEAETHRALVYLMFDADGECIYVGMTGNLRKRIGQPRRPRFNRRGNVDHYLRRSA